MAASNFLLNHALLHELANAQSIARLLAADPQALADPLFVGRALAAIDARLTRMRILAAGS